MIAPNTKLETWQDRLAEADRNYSGEVAKMDHREELYRGTAGLVAPGDWYEVHDRAKHYRNIIFENLESEVSSSIPQPKVTPRHREDEHLAEIIEHMLRNELDRMPFERINDMAERTVPLQGGVGFLIDWDNTKSTHDTVGEIAVSCIHPKQFAPQPGVYTSPEDMDWFIIKIPTTKTAIKRKYGKDVHSESESEPDIRSTGAETYEDNVTQYVGYERNEDGGINRYSWVNDVELEDLKNYQARRQPVCSKCGRTKPLPGQLVSANVKQFGDLLPNPQRGFDGGLIPQELQETLDGRSMALGMADSFMGGTEDENVMTGVGIAEGKPVEYKGGACPWCGSEEWTTAEQEYEEVILPIMTPGGVSIPGASAGIDENGNPVMRPTMIPYYKPDAYPIILQKSVSVYGQLLGNSDADAIEEQQNTVNLIEKKIVERILKSGTRITLPDRADLRVDSRDQEIWYIGNASDKNLIGTYEFKGDISAEMAFEKQVYEEARQILGITDSYQGRADSTANSGAAKQFSAAQAAGRLESKRVMKDAAYAELFEIMFKFRLAYSDEPVSVSYKDEKGRTVYEEFNRYDFLKQDEQTGEWYWEDQFLFSVDSSAPLASNREQMWKETRENLQTGAFGDPASLETLILFWEKMQELHYPGAGKTKSYLGERLQQQMQQQQQMMQMQQQMAAQQAMPQQAAQGAGAAPGAGEAPQQEMQPQEQNNMGVM